MKLFKICSICTKNKRLKDFHKNNQTKDKLYRSCKDCRREYQKKNKEKINNYQRNYRKENFKRLYLRDRLYQNQRYMDNIQVRLNRILRTRIHHALNGLLKFGSTMKLIGCSTTFLKKHLEKQFKSGMSWDNYGLHNWHIDHKIPCNKFDLSKESEQKKCFHYTNLQPLWAKENWSKGKKYNER